MIGMDPGYEPGMTFFQTAMARLNPLGAGRQVRPETT